MRAMIDSIVADAITLWVVLNPIGTVPLFLAVTGHETPAGRQRIAARAVLIAGVILTAFIALGQILLTALGISLASFQVAGGIVLLSVALKMILGDSPQDTEPDRGRAKSGADVAVFPVAMPFIAGPASIMAVVMLTDNDRFSIAEQARTTVVMLGVLVLVYLTLRASETILRVLGATGINVLTRIMGLILAALAVQSILGGVRQSFSG
jgi:multiple antibiotic resistance protein